jgi:hypothetical protein
MAEGSGVLLFIGLLLLVGLVFVVIAGRHWRG